VGLAFVEGGEAVVGVLGMPNWSLPVLAVGSAQPRAVEGGVIVYAAKGAGAWVRPLAGGADGSADFRVQVDAAAAFTSGGTLCVSDHEAYGALPMAAALAAAGPPPAVLPLCCGSLCKYGAVAVGAASAFIQHPVKGFPALKTWDHAAGVVCVQEAGGRVSDLHGGGLPMSGARAFVPGGGGVAVTNGATHDGLLAAAIGAGMWWRGPPAEELAQEGLSSRSGQRLRLPFLVCLDRDGVINQDVGSPGVTDAADLRLIPGAATAIAALNASGAHVCIVTNQSAVGKGLLTPTGLQSIHDKLRAELAAAGAWVDGILVACDAAVSGASRRRKPGPGMLEEAMSHFGVGPSRTVFVGDTMTDMQAAAAAGVPRRALVATGYGAAVRRALAAEGVALPATLVPSDGAFAGVPPEVLPLTVHTDLPAVVRLLLEHGQLSVPLARGRQGRTAGSRAT